MDSIINFFSSENLVFLLDTVNKNGIWVFIGAFILFVISKMTAAYNIKEIKKIAEITKNADTYKDLHSQMMKISEKNENFLKLMDEKTDRLITNFNTAREQYEIDKENTKSMLEIIDFLENKLSKTVKELEQTRENYENLNGINNIIEPINDIHSKVQETGDYINNINKETKEISEQNAKDIDYIKKNQSDIMNNIKKIVSIKKNNVKQLNEIKNEILNSKEIGKIKNLKILLDLIEQLDIEKNKINYNI
jgi:methyl-accepting chemotaxis protein